MKFNKLFFLMTLLPSPAFAGLLDTHQQRHNGKDQYMVFNYVGLHVVDANYEVKDTSKVKGTDKIDGITGEWKGYGANYNLGLEINRAFQFNSGVILNSTQSVNGYYLSKTEAKIYASLDLVLFTPFFNVILGGGGYSSSSTMGGPDFSQKLNTTGTMYQIKAERMLSQYYSVSFYYIKNHGIATPEKDWVVKGTQTSLGKFDLNEDSKEIGFSLSSWFY